MLGLRCYMSFSVVVVSGGYSLAVLYRLLLWYSMGSRVLRLQQLRLPDSRTELYHTGVVAPGHVGSSLIRDKICVSFTGRPNLYHCLLKEDPAFYFIFLPTCPV